MANFAIPAPKSSSATGSASALERGFLTQHHVFTATSWQRPWPTKLARIAWSILRNEKTFDINRHEATVI